MRLAEHPGNMAGVALSLDSVQATRNVGEPRWQPAISLDSLPTNVLKLGQTVNVCDSSCTLVRALYVCRGGPIHRGLARTSSSLLPCHTAHHSHLWEAVSCTMTRPAGSNMLGTEP